MDFEKSLIDLVNLPYTYENNELLYRPSEDAIILNCGCIISESLIKELISNFGKFKCPLCQSTTKILTINKQLRQLFTILSERGLIVNNSIQSHSTNTEKETLLSLFYSIAKDIDDNVSETSSSAISFHSNEMKSSEKLELKPQRENSSISLSLLSKFPSNTKRTNSINRIDSEHKEYLFVKCFPMYRRHYQHQTHSKLFKTKSKIFSNVSISTNCKFFVLLSSKKFEVYEINHSNFKLPPTLYCCGTNKGEYGKSFENLIKINNKNEIKGGGFSNINDPNGLEFKKKLNDWEFLYCSISNNLLIISGTNGILRIFNLLEFGKPIYTYCSNFPIRCIDISPNSKLIACGITGKDRISGSEQALIVMHSLNFEQNNDYDDEFNLNNLISVDPITITFPYHDPINHITFSNDSNYLSCSTALESRFLTVSVKDPTKPKLVMKAIRTLDTSLESEGITSFKMFPNNKYMVVSSVAFNAPPIIIDNNIRSISMNKVKESNSTSNVIEDLTSEITKPIKFKNNSNYQKIAQPRLLQRIDEVGNNIHKVSISPRNDSIAMLDKNGAVYLMFATNMEDSSSKRLVLVDQVSNSFRVRESASLSFSKDGHQLFIVDRKGILYINDFSAGLPSNPEITRCKQLGID